ncbi:hypothetical protein [Roseomonas sp. BN140053]|uniref:hypothetical protein n=1 Tax=Roseomonas sp. BN140053 TaxID=3391898 RepID=UPI0039E775D5
MSGSVFRRQVSVFVDRSLTPAAQSARLAAVAIEGREELIRSGRASPSYSTTVDGREGAPEAQVRPDGRIVYRFNLLGEAAVFAMSFLRSRAPSRSGRFKDSFVYAVGEGFTGGPARGTWHNGAKVAASYGTARIIRTESFDPQRLDAAEVLLFNQQPYSRKVDVQMAGSRRLRFEVPPGMFDDAAAAVRRRFPTIDARRIYTVLFPGGWRLKTGQNAGKQVQSPALVISTRG